MKNLNVLKSRAARMGLLIRQDRTSRAFDVTQRGNARAIFSTVDAARLDGFLSRHDKATKAAAKKAHDERMAYIEYDLRN